jgi:DNA-binding winged helix-turn-helix (wHTH) protein/Tfp pilus assembly protein PilF
MKPHTYEFADFFLDASQRILLKAGVLVHIDPKPFELLRYFLNNSERVISRDELLIRIVDSSEESIDPDQLLTKYIAVLRKILDDKTKQIIRTEPKKGYKFSVKPTFHENVPPYHKIYERGRHFWNQPNVASIHKAIEKFNEVLEEDPNYALAWSGLADCWILRSTFGHQDISEHIAMKEAEKAAEKALAINPNLGEAWAAKGAVQAIYHWQWDNAKNSFENAIGLSPNPETRAWFALLQAGRGEHEAARAIIDSALSLNNPPGFLIALSGRIYYLAREYDKAFREFDEGIAATPDFYLNYIFKGQTLRCLGKYKEAEKNFLKAAKLTYNHPSCIAELGHLYGKIGDLTKLNEKLTELTQTHRRMYCSPYLKAHVNLGGDELHSKFRKNFYEIIWREVIPTRSGFLIFFPSDPIYDNLREDKTFQSIVKTIRVVQ